MCFCCISLIINADNAESFTCVVYGPYSGQHGAKSVFEHHAEADLLN